jgi:hypothetical protein
MVCRREKSLKNLRDGKCQEAKKLEHEANTKSNL